MKTHIADRTNGIKPSQIRVVLGKVVELKSQGIHITDFSIGRPDFNTPQHIIDATKEALDKGLVHYAASQGTKAFQEAVCYRYKEDYDLTVDPDDVVATVGASQAIYAAFQAILNPGDEIVVPEPMYVYYEGLAFLSGAKVVSVPLTLEEEFIPTAEKIEKYITPKTKAILLTSPNNPTGQVIEKAEIIKIAEVAVKHDLIVIADDIYNGTFYDDVDYMPIAKVPGMMERTITIGSFSKTYAMDGWRIGYLILPKPLFAGTLKLHQHMISCPNTFVQNGAIAALTSSQQCVKDMNAEFDRRRKLVMEHFDKNKISYVRPRGAFYVFPDLNEFNMSSQDMAMYLLNEARVAMVPGGAFGASGEGHIRVALSTTYEEIGEGMVRMAAALDKLRNK